MQIQTLLPMEKQKGFYKKDRNAYEERVKEIAEQWSDVEEEEETEEQ